MLGSEIIPKSQHGSFNIPSHKGIIIGDTRHFSKGCCHQAHTKKLKVGLDRYCQLTRNKANDYG